MRARMMVFLTVVLAVLSLTASSAFAVGERSGVFVDGRWLGSYNTFPGGDAAYCIDSGRGYPLSTYNWVSTPDTAPSIGWLLWKYGNTTDNDTAAAVSWIIHQSVEVPHADVVPFGTPSAAVQPRINAIVPERQSHRGPQDAQVVPPSLSPARRSPTAPASRRSR